MLKIITPFILCFVIGVAYCADSIDLRDKMTPVKHQKKRNTCSVFAATSLMEFLVSEREKQCLTLSENYNYWLGKTKALNSRQLKKWYEPIDGLAGYLAVDAYKYGAMLATDWPYESHSWKQSEDSRCVKKRGKYIKECFTNGSPPKNGKILNYRIKPIRIHRRKIGEWMLVNKKPVVFNIYWCGKLVDKKGNMRMPSPKEWKECNLGGHVITLAGYDRNKKLFIFRNSWGSSWGDNGYGTIPEAFINKHCESCDNLPYSQYTGETRKMVKYSSMGTSGSLVR